MHRSEQHNNVHSHIIAMDNRLGYIMRFSNDYGTIGQRCKRPGGYPSPTGPPPERRSTISNMHGDFHNNSNNRMRNLSGGSVGSTASGSSRGSCSNLDNQYSSGSNSSFSHFPLDISSPFANTRTMNPSTTNPSSRPYPSSSTNSLVSSSSILNHNLRGSNTNSNVIRSDHSISYYSDNDNSNNGSTSPTSLPMSSTASQQQQNQRSVNSSRYKTELCRPFEESGSCKYGDKCQFAHGMHELRNLSRHPKYKTELCRTFHSSGYCPYGPRCHFVHEEEPSTCKPDSASMSPRLARSGSVQSSSSGSTSPSLSPSSCSEPIGVFNYHEAPYSALSVNTGSGYDNLDREFGMLNLNKQGDIFSQADMFSEKDVDDNAPATNSYMSRYNRDSFPISTYQPGPLLDNFPSMGCDYWNPAMGSEADQFLSRVLGSLGALNDNDIPSSTHSPTGSASTTDGCCSGSSSGSDSGSNNGSTENLTLPRLAH